MGLFGFLYRTLFRPHPLGTSLRPAGPFLLDPKTGKPLQQDAVSNRYFYHATNYLNLSRIRKGGMDPGAGGKGGAGDRVGDERFKKRSAGKVHATASTHTASFYGVLQDEPSLFVKAFGDRLFQGQGAPSDPDELNKLAVVLRFKRRLPGVVWEKDPDDPREAYRTPDKIAPQHIEALTTEGWVKVEKLTELGAALSIAS